MAGYVWKPDYYVTAYEYARNGMCDAKIAAAIGVSHQTIVAWCKKKPAFRDAIDRGRKIAKGHTATQTFREFVFQRLPPNLKNLWRDINAVENEKNGIRRVEAMLSEAGKRARQHLFLYSLTSTNFNLSESLRKVNISRGQFDRWVTQEPDFASLINEVIQYKKDFYENSLITSCASGDTAAIIFANKTFNKDRGYNEKIDVSINGSISTLTNAVSIDELRLPIETRRQILEAIRALQPKDEPEDGADAQGQ